MIEFSKQNQQENCKQQNYEGIFDLDSEKVTKILQTSVKNFINRYQSKPQYDRKNFHHDLINVSTEIRLYSKKIQQYFEKFKFFQTTLSVIKVVNESWDQFVNFLDIEINNRRIYRMEADRQLSNKIIPTRCQSCMNLKQLDKIKSIHNKLINPNIYDPYRYLQYQSNPNFLQIYEKPIQVIQNLINLAEQMDEPDLLRFIKIDTINEKIYQIQNSVEQRQYSMTTCLQQLLKCQEKILKTHQNKQNKQMRDKQIIINPVDQFEDYYHEFINKIIKLVKQLRSIKKNITKEDKQIQVSIPNQTIIKEMQKQKRKYQNQLRLTHTQKQKQIRQLERSVDQTQIKFEEISQQKVKLQVQKKILIEEVNYLTTQLNKIKILMQRSIKQNQIIQNQNIQPSPLKNKSSKKPDKKQKKQKQHPKKQQNMVLKQQQFKLTKIIRTNSKIRNSNQKIQRISQNSKIDPFSKVDSKNQLQNESQINKQPQQNKLMKKIKVRSSFITPKPRNSFNNGIKNRLQTTYLLNSYEQHKKEQKQIEDKLDEKNITDQDKLDQKKFQLYVKQAIQQKKSGKQHRGLLKNSSSFNSNTKSDLQRTIDKINMHPQQQAKSRITRKVSRTIAIQQNQLTTTKNKQNLGMVLGQISEERSSRTSMILKQNLKLLNDSYDCQLTLLYKKMQIKNNFNMSLDQFNQYVHKAIQNINTTKNTSNDNEHNKATQSLDTKQLKNNEQKKVSIIKKKQSIFNKKNTEYTSMRNSHKQSLMNLTTDNKDLPLLIDAIRTCQFKLNQQILQPMNITTQTIDKNISARQRFEDLDYEFNKTDIQKLFFSQQNAYEFQINVNKPHYRGLPQLQLMTIAEIKLSNRFLTLIATVHSTRKNNYTKIKNFLICPYQAIYHKNPSLEIAKSQQFNNKLRKSLNLLICLHRDCKRIKKQSFSFCVHLLHLLNKIAGFL